MRVVEQKAIRNFNILIIICFSWLIRRIFYILETKVLM
jgi:hypothetical protein